MRDFEKAKIEAEAIATARQSIVDTENARHEKFMKYEVNEMIEVDPIVAPTVKELIAILSKLPEDYRVYSSGAECFLYVSPQNKTVNIDCESTICE